MPDYDRLSCLAKRIISPHQPPSSGADQGKVHDRHKQQSRDRNRKPPVVSGLRSRNVSGPQHASPSSSTMPTTPPPPKRWWRRSSATGAARPPSRPISPIPPPSPVCSTLRRQRSAASMWWSTMPASCKWRRSPRATTRCSTARSRSTSRACSTRCAASKRLRAGGRIINISSSVTSLLQPTYGVYAATKATAVEAMTDVLTKELRGRNITVNAIAPGPTATRLFLDGKPQEVIDRLSRAAPLERLGQPEDIAAVVAFLAGPDGVWINGGPLRANGGIIWKAVLLSCPTSHRRNLV